MRCSTFASVALVLGVAACAPKAQQQATDDAIPVAPAAGGTAAAIAPQEGIRRYLRQAYPDVAPLRYALAWHDLNSDGADEAIVYLAGPYSYFCGTGGCNTLVLAPDGPMWREVVNISVSRTPIAVANSTSEGWQDLLVSVGGGGAQAGTALLRFDGEAYPSNPTVPPAEMSDQPGSVLLVEEPEFIELAGDASSGE